MMEYALITGAASGMGRQYALQLARKGWGIAAVDRDAEGLRTLGEELAKTDLPEPAASPVPAAQPASPAPAVPAETLAAPAYIPIVADLAEDGAAAKVCLAFEKATGGGTLRILVNNAGMLFTTPVAETPPEKLRAMMMVHCVTPLLLCREFIPLMPQGSHILNVSSICAWMSWPVIGMYGNTKRFVKGFSRSLRMELRQAAISVTTALFGAVDTQMFAFSPKTRRTLRRLGLMISPERAVSGALRAMLKGRRQYFPGLGNRLLVPVLPLLPDSLLLALWRRYGKYLRYE